MRIKDAVSAYHKEFGPREFIEMYDLSGDILGQKHLGDAYPTYSWACDVAEVEVDMSTFEIKVDRMCITTMLGKADTPRWWRADRVGTFRLLATPFWKIIS